MDSGIDMQPLKHDFDGSCVPGQPDYPVTFQQTFSVGIFQYIPRGNGVGLKRSAVKVRVSGPISNPEKVYAKAREIIKQLDTGKYTGPKNVRTK